MIQLDFRPLFGLSSCHLQTIVAALIKPSFAPLSHTMHVSLDAGDKLACVVSQPSTFSQIVVLVHGLGGSSESNYMVRMAKHCFDAGIMAVRVNLRGCGAGKELSRLPYNGGRSEDVLAVLEVLKSRYPHAEITLVGYSLGANIALKLAGELGTTNLLKKTIGVCPPIDLEACVHSIQKKQNALYHAYYVKKLCEQATSWLKSPVDSIYEFDDKVTAPLWGFSSASDYYTNSSALGYLPAIKHDCCLIFAEDDPFIPSSLIQTTSSCPVTVYVTKRGGHMGFLGYTSKKYSSRWLDELLLSKLIIL